MTQQMAEALLNIAVAQSPPLGDVPALVAVLSFTTFGASTGRRAATWRVVGWGS
ncbi:hypothetical protein [Reticulibacter mediterranei]|uniref:hypothetical protein n=1 Tax=Reticulibacter mediterranei TaxID=2778369 RepID=UPI001C689603|nr:hypothetical protein [Reticulibacter mediterranei]